MSGHRIKQYNSEAVTHERVVDYIHFNYKDVIIRTDFAAGIKLPEWLAKQQKRLHNERGFPDITIFEPVERESPIGIVKFCGLFLELKAADIHLRKRDGSWASEHIERQAGVMHRLQQKGYMCSFACGFEEAKAVLDFYLTGRPTVSFDDLVPTVVDMDDASRGTPLDSPF